jgi:hypothetical protein
LALKRWRAQAAGLWQAMAWAQSLVVVGLDPKFVAPW